jgi:phage terminase small subunit
MTKLTPKQEQFVREYLIDLNATQAAIRAGYSAKTANEQGSRLLANVSVRSAIEKAQQARAERTEITADRVLKEIGRIAFFDIRKLYREEGGGMKDPHELDDDAAAVLVGVDVVEMQGGAEVGGEDGIKHAPTYVKKAKIADKVAALTLAARHLGMLKDKLEHSGKVGVGPVDLSDAQLAAIATAGSR